MSVASGSWTVVIDGRSHQVAAEWDLSSTGGGSITVDGAVVEQWSFGLKWPGAQRQFSLVGRGFAIAKRGVFDRQLDLFAKEPGLGWPLAPAAPKGWLRVVAVAVVLLLVAMAIVLMTELHAQGRR